MSGGLEESTVMDPGAWVWPCHLSFPSTHQTWATQSVMALSLWSVPEVLACDSRALPLTAAELGDMPAYVEVLLINIDQRI